MRVVYVCGYDGCECEKYKVRLDHNGRVIPPEVKCNLTECDRCYFMGEPWVRIEIQKDERR